MPQKQSNPISRDWLVLGGLTGVLASVVQNGFAYSLQRLGFPVLRYGSVASNTILGKRRPFWSTSSRPQKPGGWAVGYAGDAAIGGAFGASIAYLHAKTPPGNEVIKGAGAGLVLWALTLSLGNQMRISRLQNVAPKRALTMLAGNVAYGALQSWMIKKFGSRFVTQSRPELSTNVPPNTVISSTYR